MGKIQLPLLADDLMLVTERDEDANRSGNVAFIFHQLMLILHFVVTSSSRELMQLPKRSEPRKKR